MSSGAMGSLDECLMSSLLEDFAAAARSYPTRVALVNGSGRETTFADLHGRSEELARAWQAQGVRRGERVLLAMTVDADLYASLAALWSLGATVVLPEPAMGLKGLQHAARVTEAKWYCSAKAYTLLGYALPALWRLKHLRTVSKEGALLDLAATDEQDIALISFTSGTTGAPKAIPRSHGFMSAQHHAIAPLLQSEEEERDLVAFPVFVLINIAAGRTSVLPNWKMSRLEALSPSLLAQWIGMQRVTRVLIPPALCEKLAQADVPLGLKRVFTGGGPVFPSILNRLKRAKPELEVTCVYGSTEAEPIAHLGMDEISKADFEAMVAGCGLLAGRPVPEIRLRIEADEILVAGEHVNEGYLDPRHDAANKIRDGDIVWHRTGDAGYLDAQGRLWLLGRKGSEVILAEAPTYPFSVEVAAQAWIGVRRCACVASTLGPCLVIEGDVAHLSEWEARASQMGIGRVKYVAKIPMDRRHASKIDRASLLKKLGR